MGETAGAALKILQVVHKPQRRGAEVFALQLGEHLRSEGHEVRTVYLYPHDEPNALPLGAGDTVLNGRVDHIFERFPGINPMLLKRLGRCIDEMRPDVVQANGGRTVKYCAGIAAMQKERSWVLIYRNIGQPRYWLHGWRREFYARLVMPRLDGVIGVSTTTLQTVKDLYSLSVPTTRIPCAVDSRTVTPTMDREMVRAQMDTPLGAPVIMCAGSLTDEKRIDRLIRAASVVKKSVPNLHLWIVGGGPLRSALETQVQLSPLAECARFVGAQNHVANFMVAADVVALTSDTEGMPAVLLEAGLLGLPVVATRVGGVAECVLDGQTGILVQRNDDDALVEALRDLLQQPERRGLLGSAAKTWIEENFTMSHVAQQYAAFYRQVLAR